MDGMMVPGSGQRVEGRKVLMGAALGLPLFAHAEPASAPYKLPVAQEIAIGWLLGRDAQKCRSLAELRKRAGRLPDEVRFRVNDGRKPGQLVIFRLDGWRLAVGDRAELAGEGFWAAVGWVFGWVEERRHG